MIGWRQLPWGVWLCAVLAVCFSGLVREWAYRDRVLTTDENAYVFQAACFLDGTLARPLPQPPERFQHPMLILDEEAGWLSRYPPVHALWLLPGVALGWPDLMPHLGAGLSLLLLALFAQREGLSPLAMAVLTLVSPFWLFMHASWLSHTSALACTAGMLLGHQAWRQRGGKSGPMLMGVCWALLFLNRTYTATLLALPFGVDACWRLWQDRGNRNRWLETVWFAGISGSGAVLFKLYNKLATGSSRMSTYLLYDPSEGLGFGPRHTKGLPVEHTLERGLENGWENLIALDRWVFGWPGGLVVLMVLLLIGWQKKLSPLLLMAPLVVWAGYVGFWFPGIEHFRPVYSFELLPFLLVGGLMGGQSLVKHLPETRRVLHLSALAVAMGVLSLAFALVEGQRFRARNEESAQVKAHLETQPTGRLVFLEALGHDTMHENMLNLHGLDSEVLVMRSRGVTDRLAARLYPEREPWVLSGTAATRLRPLEMPDPMTMSWLGVESGKLTGRNGAGVDGQVARLAGEGDPEGFLSFGRYLPLTPGTWQLRCRVRAREAEGSRLELAADLGRRILSQEPVVETGKQSELVLAFELEEIQTVEPRVWYGGQGQLEVLSFTLEEIP